jgi:hypothetical protein
MKISKIFDENDLEHAVGFCAFGEHFDKDEFYNECEQIVLSEEKELGAEEKEYPDILLLFREAFPKNCIRYQFDSSGEKITYLFCLAIILSEEV